MKNILLLKSVLLLAIILPMFFNVGCTNKIYDVVYPTLTDGRYDSEFPYKNASDQLEDISSAVKRLNYVAYYKAYVFEDNQNIVRTDLNNSGTKDLSINQIYFKETGSGTASIIFYDGDIVGLLTCAHIGNHPDTILTYFESGDIQKKQNIHYMAVKQREHYYINGIQGEGDFEVVVSDKKRDLAILSKKVFNDPFLSISVFKYPLGESGDLELGSFVYIIGYPMGLKMITKGIVSNTRDNRSDSFLIDALFNRGFSGGIILAIRDGVPNFELVGLAKAVSAKNEYLLIPSQVNDQYEYEPNIPYKGDFYIKKIEDINYGITYTISTDEIKKFLKENESVLLKKGFNFDYLIK